MTGWEEGEEEKDGYMELVRFENGKREVEYRAS